MKSRAMSGAAAFGLVGLGAIGLGVGGAAAPAEAFVGTCPVTVPAATLVADNVCEVQITAAGASSFTPPTGIAKLSAVLVAGGGGGLFATSEYYAGSGGAVTYIDSVPTTGPVAISVGAGGTLGGPVGNGFVDPTAGGDTTLTAGTTTTAAGGIDGETAGPPDCSGVNDVISGNGAQTNADSNCVAGVGYSLAQLSGLDATLFPAASLGPDVYGNGGTGTDSAVVPISTLPGAGGSVDTVGAQNGNDGLVILRFDPRIPVVPASPALAATGSSVSPMVPAGSIVAILAGALLFVASRRRRAER